MKGRRPIFLQVYHHTGAVIGMWLILISKSSVGYLFVVENSFIHSIMYLYYAMAVLGYRWKTKFVLTLLQIIQFVTGLTILRLLLAFGNYEKEEKYKIDILKKPVSKPRE